MFTILTQTGRDLVFIVVSRLWALLFLKSLQLVRKREHIFLSLSNEK